VGSIVTGLFVAISMIWPERRFVSVKAREDHSEREKRAA
jgi:hypothetical protein